MISPLRLGIATTLSDPTVKKLKNVLNRVRNVLQAYKTFANVSNLLM